MHFYSIGEAINKKFLTKEELEEHHKIGKRIDFYFYCYFAWTIVSASAGVVLSTFMKAPYFMKHFLASYSPHVIRLDALCFSTMLIILGGILFGYKAWKAGFVTIRFKNIFARIFYKPLGLSLAALILFFAIPFGGEFVGGRFDGPSKQPGEGLLKLLFSLDVFGVSIYMFMCSFTFYLMVIVFLRYKIFPKIGF